MHGMRVHVHNSIVHVCIVNVENMYMWVHVHVHVHVHACHCTCTVHILGMCTAYTFWSTCTCTFAMHRCNHVHIGGVTPCMNVYC